MKQLRTGRARRAIASSTAATMAVGLAVAVMPPAAAEEPESETTALAPTADLFVQGGDAQITESLLAGRGRETLMRFDLAEISDDVVVTAATLDLTKYHGSGNTIVLSDVVGAWDETVSRDSMPELGAEIGRGDVPSGQAEVSFDLADPVAEAVAAGQDDFDVHLDQLGEWASEFRSTRYGVEDERPMLSVTTMTTDTLVEADAADLASLVNNPVYTDVELPGTGERGSQITWTSSAPDIVAADGTVTRPAAAEDATAVLTAEVTYGDSRVSVDVEVVVRGVYDVEPQHPQVLAGQETDQRVEDLVASEGWAAESFDAIVEKIEPYADRHQDDPEWILSRMAMFWEEGERYTQVYIKDQRFDYAEGNAPVPTLRFPAMRIWNDNKNAPLEERLPYSEDGSMVNQDGEVVPYEETGHMIRLNNEEILSLAEEAAFLYHHTGEQKYAKFGADIYWQWLMGVYYMNPALDPGESMGGPGGYAPGGNMGYYEYEVIHDPMGGQAAIVYDYLFDYLQENPDPHLDVIGEDMVDVSSEVFKRFIDIGMVRGAQSSNWNVNGWKCILDAILALEPNDYYADGKGREHYLHYYTTETTQYHNALPEILQEYDQTTGLWPESSGYATGMVGALLDFAAPVYNNGVDTIGENPMLEKAALAVGAWLDDRGNLVVFGDGRGGQPSYSPFERLNWYYQEVGDAEGAAAASTVIRNAIEAGVYERSSMSYLDLQYSAPLVESTGAGTDVSQMAYSPHHRHLVQRNGQGAENALMATLYGGWSGNYHLTANGLAAQIYGKGWATGPQAKSYESYWSDDITYSRHEAGANTVVPGYNHGEITVNALDPEVPDDALTNVDTVSPWNSFSDVSANDHRRQLAIVRTSPTTGYYVDVFRADQEESDYLWHSLGDRVELTGAEGEPLELAAADDLGSPVPTYRFFSDPAKVAHDEDLRARWTVDDGVSDGVDLVTDMWMAGGEGREVYTVTAPPTTARDNITPGNVNAHDDPTEAVVVRQNGTNAAETPFAAVFESTGSDELSVTDVDEFGDAAGFTGLEVLSADLDGRSDRVFTSTGGGAVEPVEGAEFAGLYGVHSTDDDGFVSLYLGSGTQLVDGGTGVTLDESGAAWLDTTEGGYTYTATQPGTLRLPLGTPDGEATVEIDAGDGWTSVDSAVDGDSLLVDVPAGEELQLRVTAPEPQDSERPVVELVSPSSAGPFSQVSVQVDATDDTGLKRIVANIYRDGELVKSTQSAVADGATSGSHSAQVSLPDGDYSMKYNAEDLAGNIARTGRVEFSIDGTAPRATVKSGERFTVGAGPYDKVSFKLFDAGKVDRVEINGVVKNLSDNKWSDVNFLTPGTFGAVQGANVLEVFDVAGNSATVEFTLN